MELSVLGQKYSIRAAGGPEHVARISAVFNGKIDEVRRATRSTNPLSLAVLAGLNLAEDLVAAESRSGQFKKDVAKKVQKMLAWAEELRVGMEQAAMGVYVRQRTVSGRGNDAAKAAAGLGVSAENGRGTRKLGDSMVSPSPSSNGSRAARERALIGQQELGF